VPAPVENDTEPLRAVAAVGWNFTETVQLAEAARDVVQVVETKLKSVPVTDAAVGTVTEIAARPVFCSVDVKVLEPATTTFPNGTADSVALGAWPVPVKLTLAMPPPLCVKLKEPVRVPATDGVKLTLTVQVPLTATAPQLFDCAKSDAPAEIPTPVNVNVLVPVLVTVTA
jgi:hypothetical protein